MSIQIPAGRAPASIEAATAALRGKDAARIPPGLRVQGEAHYPCDVALEGDLEGTLTLTTCATLLVTKDANVQGTVTAGATLIEGAVNGRIDCSNGAVEFAPTARCSAQVLYRELSVARGAEVEAGLQKVGA